MRPTVEIRGDELSFDMGRCGWDEGKAVVGHGVGVGNTVGRSVIFCGWREGVQFFPRVKRPISMILSLNHD